MQSAPPPGPVNIDAIGTYCGFWNQHLLLYRTRLCSSDCQSCVYEPSPRSRADPAQPRLLTSTSTGMIHIQLEYFVQKGLATHVFEWLPAKSPPNLSLSLSLAPSIPSSRVRIRRGGPFKRPRVSLCLWLSSCMSFNFIKLENRKYELTPSTSERRGPLLRRGGGGGGGGDAEAAAAGGGRGG